MNKQVLIRSVNINLGVFCVPHQTDDVKETNGKVSTSVFLHGSGRTYLIRSTIYLGNVILRINFFATPHPHPGQNSEQLHEYAKRNGPEVQSFNKLQ